MRSHVEGNVMKNAVNNVIDEFNNNEVLSDDSGDGGWQENFIAGFYNEMKCITHKISRAVYKHFLNSIKK